MHRLIALGVAAAVFGCLLIQATPARAGDGDGTCTLAGICSVSSHHNGHTTKQNLHAGRSTTKKSTVDTGLDNKRAREAKRRFQAAYATWKLDTSAYRACIARPGTGASCGQPPRMPRGPLNDSAFGQPNPTVQLTGEEAAVSVIARLQLPTVAPEVGPPPQLNEWKMAAVGYPLWLSAGGRTHVGPVTDTAGGLSVSLDAKVSGVSFRMGDGHVVNCAGTGRRWSRSVQPGEASPTCGYRYTEPSLPKGSYTVAAVTTWSVRWTAGGEAGVITVPAVATTQLPVGELQVLVR